MPISMLLLALAEPSPAAQQLDVPPRFLSQPPIEDLFPARAREQLVAGVVEVQCTSGKDGLLHDCRITQETPLGWGFGQAALDGMARSSLKPGELNGQPAEARLAQTFHFRLLGVVELDCAISSDRQVDDCRVVKEEFARRELGRVALQTSKIASPSPQTLASTRNGRFRWMMGLEVPLEECPQIAERLACQQPHED